mmetsp:Transcript_25744/g.36324  ORF Transcript_25744/g.36324 Transcript_25744/m.36324 type:complete len:235 (-) Transcript_25744:150-854(-)
MVDHRSTWFTMKTILFFLVLLVGRGTITTTAAAADSTIVTLDDANFEHETQASTGSTTGSWFILFKAKRCRYCAKVQPEFERLASPLDEEFEQESMLEKHGIVLGQIDVPSNRDTTVRFGVRGFPTFIYLHQGTLYRYTGERTYVAMKEWLLSSDKGEGEPIPQPLSALETFVASIKAVGVEMMSMAKGKQGIVGYGIVIIMAVIAFLFFVTLYFIYAATIGRSTPKDDKQKKA